MFQGGGAEGDTEDGDDGLDENLMAEEVDKTLHFKGIIIERTIRIFQIKVYTYLT